MPPTITAAVVPAPRAPVELRQFPEPAMAPGGLLLKTSTIIVTGAPADRPDLARQMSAGIVLDVSTTTVDERRDLVMQATAGRGPDIAIEASGAARAIDEALTLVPLTVAAMSSPATTPTRVRAASTLTSTSIASISRSADPGGARQDISCARSPGSISMRIASRGDRLARVSTRSIASTRRWRMRRPCDCRKRSSTHTPAKAESSS